jgi:hypothetical protein
MGNSVQHQTEPTVGSVSPSVSFSHRLSFLAPVIAHNTLNPGHRTVYVHST